MSDVLTRICDDKRGHIARSRAARPFATVDAEAHFTWI